MHLEIFTVIFTTKKCPHKSLLISGLCVCVWWGGAKCTPISVLWADPRGGWVKFSPSPNEQLTDEKSKFS